MSHSKKQAKKVLYFTAMFLFSMAIIASEMIFFHMLLNVSHYLTATFVITIAMLGIAMGSIISFYLIKLKNRGVMLIASVLFILSIVLSYYNILHIVSMGYPYFLILPFIFGSIIISGIFSHAHSNSVYFINLIASALGVVFPLIFVAIFKSEGSLILIMILPAVFMAYLAFFFKKPVWKWVLFLSSGLLSIAIIALLVWNMSIPSQISQEDVEKKIMPSISEFYKGDARLKDFAVTIFNKAYSNTGSTYILEASDYDRKAAQYLLNKIGYLKQIDLLYNSSPQEVMYSAQKVYGAKEPILLSEDNLMGRIEYFGNGRTTFMSVNGVVLDNMSQGNGAYMDPRVPWMDDAKVFIIGLSADGIVKSAKRLTRSQVSGIEINPTILRTMQEDGPFAKFANYPYKDLGVYEGEGRAFLESRTNLYDMITLMNIHMEHGPISTLAPEFFHTVEATEMMLTRLTPRGMIVYEEIILNHRSRLAFYKMINTWVQALKNLGVEKPEENIMIFSWDFWGGNAFRTVMIKKNAFNNKEIRLYNNFLSSIEMSSNYSGVAWYAAPDKIRNNLETQLIRQEPVLFMDYLPAVFEVQEFKEEVLNNLQSKQDLELIKKYYPYNKAYQIYVKKSALNEEDNAVLKGLLQKAGYPVEVDLRPVYDDNPFPYNVYKDKKEINDLMKIVLILSGFLLLPVLILMIIRNRKHKHKLALPTVFFAFTGFGYMLTEIVMMQYFQRFIGNPSYALAVTLGGLLLFSGLGSFFSRNWKKKALVISLSLIPAILLLYVFSLDWIFSLFASWGFTGKIVLSALLLFPLTFLMGVPFPHAVEAVKQRDGEEYGALMFGISGAFSSMASTASLMISVYVGFSLSFFIGVASYGLAIPLFIRLIKKHA